MSHSETQAVRTEVVGKAGLIILNNPPVNALGLKLREGIVDALSELNGDANVEAIVIYGEGKAISAGADITEFGKTPKLPTLPEVVNAIETSGKPVATVLHGVALGGGLEVCLASHARVALKGTLLGLPEVTLGLLPGAGGTQRLTRLVDLETAIDLITSGRKVDAAKALEIGLVDQIGQGAPRDVALKAANDIIEGDLKTRVTGELTAEIDVDVLAAAQEKYDRKRPKLIAPIKAVEAASHAAKPIQEGAKLERELFLELMESPDRQGLIHAFSAERATRQFPEAGAQPRACDTAGVIGGGTMGVGIATAMLLAGITVTILETSTERADNAKAAIEKNLASAVKRGKLSEKARDERLASLSASADLTDLSDVDVVVEAVFEDLAVKTEIFQKLDKICKPGAVLGTNTSYLDVNDIAAATSRPESVVGLHFFSPAHIMRLLEVVVADKTTDDVVATALAMAARMKKVAVRSGVCDGFIGNRILAHYRKVADYLLLDGNSFEQVDKALEDFGFAMGPFAVGDLAGLDIGWATRKRKAPTRPAEERYVTIADHICENGWFGRKTGRGYYLYGDSKSREPNPDVVEIVEQVRASEGIEPRAVSDEEIVSRYMTAMISEASRVVEEGIALRPIDVDAVFLFGYGFPRHLGGPLNYADRVGAAQLVAQIETYAKEDPHYWQVPSLLQKLADSNGSFADLN